MKKLNKLLSLFLILVLLVPFIPASKVEADPLTNWPLLTGDQYFNITNTPGSLSGVSNTVEFFSFYYINIKGKWENEI